MSIGEGGKINHPLKRLALLCVGLTVMAFGIAFSIKAALGTSPISSAPYVTSMISGMSVGATTIAINFLFVLIQIVILRRRFDWFQLFQLPAVVLFGSMIDVAEYAIQGIAFGNYFQQWALCALGIFFVALGVSIEVEAKLVTTPGEGVVLAICQVTPAKFGNMKVAFDLTLVCVSVVLSLCFLGGLYGVREGTVVAAACVGLIAKQLGKLMKKLDAVLLQ